MPISYKNYPKNWKTEIRPAVLERANNCCETCGVKNESIIWRNPKNKEQFKYWPEGMESEAWTLDGMKSTRIILTIAHLNHDTTDNRMENLKAMCQLHHLRHDSVFHSENRKKNINKKKKLQTLFQ